jgi:uncharacterized protein YbaP (TraB family)
MKLASPRFGALYAAILVVLGGGAAPLRAQDKSFLWRVQSDKNTVYILGSLHLLKKDNYPLNRKIEAAFERSSKIVFEVDLRAMEPEKTTALLAERGMYRDGTTLAQKVSQDTYALASERAKGLGIDIRALSQFKPWVVALTLSQLKLQKIGLDPRYGVDRHFFRRARDVNKTTLALESSEAQLALFDQMSDQQQELMLRQTLKDLNQLDSGLDRLVAAWLAGDTRMLEELLLGGFKEFPELYQRLMVERNRKWIPQLERFLAEREVHMVIVGAGHLVGKESVIELLRERGYTVEQL